MLISRFQEKLYIYLPNFVFYVCQNKPLFWKFRLQLDILKYTVSDEPIQMRETCLVNTNMFYKLNISNHNWNDNTYCWFNSSIIV